ncbi:MAG: hypothetical protein ACOYD7_00495 [Raoultibacter sp.]
MFSIIKIKMTELKNIPPDESLQPVSLEKQTEVRRAYESGTRVFVRAVLMIVAIVVGVLVLLYIVAALTQHESIPEMLVELKNALFNAVQKVAS